jgi:hypothetical protein
MSHERRVPLNETLHNGISSSFGFGFDDIKFVGKQFMSYEDLRARSEILHRLTFGLTPWDGRGQSKSPDWSNIH